MSADTSKPLVTVLTPFYNTADYLEESITSVLAQSYEHFEYILVDNQSTDDSAKIASKFAATDRRVRFLETPRFFTQGENYNFALSHMSPTSAYCKLVQADDWIFPNCLTE